MMDSFIGWEAVRTAAAVVSAMCAIVAAGVSLAVLRKARSADMTHRIDAGDRATRKHTDKSVSEIKQTLVDVDQRLSDLEGGVARMSQEQQHALKARDLGPMHEKINGLAQAVAANTATTKAVQEQMRLLTEHLIKGGRQ
ncbi:hypothetical protein [Dyella sp. 20L07]|uniref:hypothetical protein n=1 Tax=Dyella sp. 20L07 TaxID=3384240 RepID=UPI003D29E22B